MRIGDWSSDVCSSDLPVKPFRTAAAWEKWLAAHRDARGIWLKIAKKDSGIASVTYAEALDVALCHGWIDGQKRGCDAQYFLQRFTPRRPKGVWSKINIGHAERLVAAGRMQPAGLREIEAAKADGRWDAAYEGAARKTGQGKSVSVRGVLGGRRIIKKKKTINRKKN